MVVVPSRKANEPEQKKKKNAGKSHAAGSEKAWFERTLLKLAKLRQVVGGNFGPCAKTSMCVILCLHGGGSGAQRLIGTID